MTTFVAQIRTGMNVYELLASNIQLLGLMDQSGINVADMKYLQAYKEYLRLKEEGVKITYIMAVMQDQFGINERTMFRVIKKFSQHITV